jgi:hypothetical protein
MELEEVDKMFSNEEALEAMTLEDKEKHATEIQQLEATKNV